MKITEKIKQMYDAHKFSRALIKVMAVAAVTLPAAAQADGMVKLTGVAHDNGKPISRLETMMDLPVNGDLYIVAEHTDETDLYRIRPQIFPLMTEDKTIGLGIAASHLDHPFAGVMQGVGPALTLRKKDENGFVRMDARYFNEQDLLDVYAFFQNDKVFADLLMFYDTAHGKANVLRPGVDVRINDNLSVGLEMNAQGPLDDLEKIYIGPRLKLQR